MLYASLICSGIILVAAILAARYSQNPVHATLGWAAAVTLIPVLLMAVFKAVWLQSAIMCGGFLIAGCMGYRRRAVVPVSLVAVVIAYGVVSTTVTREESRLEQLRAQFPFESIDERLPRPVPPSAPGNPKLLIGLEEQIEQVEGRRNHQLARLYTASVNRFVNSPGFGVVRMSSTLSNPNVEGEVRDNSPDQPDYFRLGATESEQLAARPEKHSLLRLHDDGFLDFVNPKGFGYVKSRREVAGFLSHGFSKVPADPDGKWKVASLELLGLLRDENPVVYVSPKLPRMDELKKAPTRPLDDFESTALLALRAGADLHTSEGPGQVRYLGAIRSTKHCVECHGGERGALLGAFTYRLSPIAR